MPSDGSNVCQRCQKATNSDKIPRLCVPVYFTQHVKQGSTNLIGEWLEMLSLKILILIQHNSPSTISGRISGIADA